MGGSISVESEVDRGTTFHFTIIASATPAQPRVFLRDEHPNLEGRRVLIVDDNETNLRILSLQVQSWGMHPRATTSCEDALNWIRWGEPFDIAILDMQMPEIDGVTLAEEIRAHRAPSVLPLMMLTSVGGMRGINTERAQFVASLSKPVKPSHLHNLLLNIFAGQDVSLKEQVLSTRGSELHRPTHPLHILVAEDHAVNQRVALRLLKRLGYRADVAANGVEVLDALKRQSYDLILMDVQMPEMDGEETTRTIRASLPDEQQPRIVAVTAHALKGSREQYLAAGMDDYLSKPVRLEELATVLKTCQSLTERKREQEREREQPQEPTQETIDTLPPPLDPQVTAELLDCASEEECEEIRDIIELFLESTPDLLQELHEGLARSAPKQFRQAAHTLKSSSQLGATLLSHLAARLQDMGDAGNLEHAPTVLAQAEAEYRRVQDALRAILSNLKP
jgi:CheY-like chemotaxis protein